MVLPPLRLLEFVHPAFEELQALFQLVSSSS